MSILTSKDAGMLDKIKLLLFSFLLFTTQIFAFNTAPGIENNPDNYLGPFFQGQGTFTFLSDKAALSTLVELGNRNYRINETLGFTDEVQKNRLKVGVEYLKQNIDYTFYTGVAREWVNQIATGITYQYVPDTTYLGTFEVGGFYSHAPNHDLSTLSGDIIRTGEGGTITHYINDRRIAGSNAGGANVGVSIYLWQGAELGLAANYDYVHYDMYFETNNSANGLGGSAYFNQYISKYFKIEALGEIRAPFDYYRAGFSWLIASSIGNFALGVNGGYVNGKHLLPNTKTLAITLNYLFDKQKSGWQIPPCPKTLSEWTSKPAVYLPQVLAVKDERVSYTARLICTPPTFIGPAIANQTVEVNAAITPINAAELFEGSPELTYTLLGGPWGTVSIDPVTGVITGNAPADASSAEFTVQATNDCGVVQSNTFTLTACEPPAFIGPDIADQGIDGGGPIVPINSAPLFSGPDLTFSLLGPLPWGTISIDSITGVISGDVSNVAPLSIDLQVQAANDCGEALSNIFTLSCVNCEA